ncbi:hypothetical protein [Brevundimonas balnearis]|uniref:Anti sigma-E protein RseA, N-terminal domain n=1 Tax=Brevundimonas balnearis TaxID=1572858 RepID=A0ABV6R326_9CAUL
MDATRLSELADAYGADWRRWPETERDAARSLLARDPELERVLFEARGLDAILHAAPRLDVSARLRERVIDAAPKARKGPFAWAPRATSRAPRSAWLSGAGVAAAVCAGLLVGEAAVSRAAIDIQADVVLYQAAADGVDDTEILQ